MLEGIEIHEIGHTVVAVAVKLVGRSHERGERHEAGKRGGIVGLGYLVEGERGIAAGKTLHNIVVGAAVVVDKTLECSVVNSYLFHCDWNILYIDKCKIT